MKHDFARSRRVADNMIKKFGKRTPAVLRSASGDRPCTAAVMKFDAQERMGRVMDPTDRKALVSALAPDGSVLASPDHLTEHLVTFVADSDPPIEDENLRIVAPTEPVGPSDIAIFWRLQVRR